MGLFDGLAEAREQKKIEGYMRAALKEAQKAYDMHEVPIGCVIVKDDKIIAKACNKRNHDRSVLSHAEILAISQACKKIKDWRLDGCTMYVTLEPCPMCAGAIVQARIHHVVIGAMNPKAGSAGSVINILNTPGFNHQCEVESGLLADESSALLSSFFKDLRETKDAAESTDGIAAGDDEEIDEKNVAAPAAAPTENSSEE